MLEFLLNFVLVFVITEAVAVGVSGLLLYLGNDDATAKEMFKFIYPNLKK